MLSGCSLRNRNGKGKILSAETTTSYEISSMTNFMISKTLSDRNRHRTLTHLLLFPRHFLYWGAAMGASNVQFDCKMRAYELFNRVA